MLIEGGDEEYLLYALNFMTFGNMNKKSWPNISFFPRPYRLKKSLFSKTKI